MPRSRKARSAYQRKWVAKRRKDWIVANGPCVICGAKRKLEVDHIDETKKVTHRIWRWSDVRREKELANCQVLCAKCHRKKSTAYTEKLFRQHGTYRRYRAGCRCEECVEAGEFMSFYRRFKRRTQSESCASVTEFKKVLSVKE